ncbi:hypothetical protein DIPPA_24945 [Diplonema papillatum]|nr:hypothetical protein DIPPA_24945 [Diplonema papillatum]
MGGGISLGVGDQAAQRKYRVNVAADVHGRKRNVRFAFRPDHHPLSRSQSQHDLSTGDPASSQALCNDGRPTLEELIAVVEWHFTREFQACRSRSIAAWGINPKDATSARIARRDASSPPDPGVFRADQIHRYHSSSRRWTEVRDTKTVPNGAQLYVFQPESGEVDNLEGPGVIPDPLGEAVVVSCAPGGVVVDYTLEHKLKAVFQTVDATDKRYVLLGEVHQLLLQCGSQWDFAAVEEWFERLNTRGTGRVSFAQWSRFGSEHPQLVDYLFDRPRTGFLFASPPSPLRGAGRAARRSHPNGHPPTPPPPAAAVEKVWDVLTRGGQRLDKTDLETRGVPVSAGLAGAKAQRGGGVDVAGFLWAFAAGLSEAAGRRDIQALLGTAGYAWDRRTADNLFDAADADGTGLVDRAEWRAFCGKNPTVASVIAENLARSIGELFPAEPHPGHASPLSIRHSPSPTVSWDTWRTWCHRHPKTFRAIALTHADDDEDRDFWHGAAASTGRRPDADPAWDRLSKRGSFARRSDIRELLMENGLPWDRATVGDLFDELDRDGSGRITRDEWLRFCDRNPRVARQLGATAHGSVGLRHNDADATWDRLSKGGSFARRSDIRELLMENGLLWDRATVGDLFDELDRDGSGRITRDEWFRFCDRNPHVARQLSAQDGRHSSADATWDRLSKGGSFARRSDIRELLMENELPWDRETVGDLFDELDRDGSGRVTRDEWYRFCDRNPRVARQLSAHGGRSDATWERLSKGSPYARRSDIRELLMENGLPWDRATVGDLFDELDRDGSGRITRDEWLKFCDRNPRVARALEQADRPLGRSFSRLDSGVSRKRLHGGVSVEEAVRIIWQQLTAETPSVQLIFPDQLLDLVARRPEASRGIPTHPLSWEDWWGFSRRHPSFFDGIPPGAISAWCAIAGGRPFAAEADLADAFRAAGVPWDFPAALQTGRDTVTFADWVRYAHRSPDTAKLLGAGGGMPGIPPDEAAIRDSWDQLSNGAPSAGSWEVRRYLRAVDVPWESVADDELFSSGAGYTGGSPAISYHEWAGFCGRNPGLLRAMRRASSQGLRATDSAVRHQEDDDFVQYLWDRLAGGRSAAGYAEVRDFFDSHAGLAWSAESAGDLFRALDGDVSGTVSFDEWRRFCRGHPRAVDTMRSSHGSALRSSSGGSGGGHVQHGGESAVWRELSKGAPFALRQDVRDLLVKAGIAWDQRTAEGLFDALDQNHSGRVSRDEWLRYARSNRRDVAFIASHLKQREQGEHDVWRDLSKGRSFALRTDVRDLLGQAGISWDQNAAGELFSAMDADSSGHVSEAEWTSFCRRNPRVSGLIVQQWKAKARDDAWRVLSKRQSYALGKDVRDALARAGLPCDRETAGALFTAMDRDASGHVTHDEWNAFCSSHPSAAHVLTTSLREDLDLTNPAHSFDDGADLLWKQLSKGRTAVARRDVRELLFAAGLKFDRHTVGDLFDAMDGNDSGRVTLEEWKRFCSGHPSVMRLLVARCRLHSRTAGHPRGLGDGGGRLWDQLSKGSDFAYRRDIRDLLSEAGVPWDRDTVGDFFDSIDTDGSGRVTREEWSRFCDRNPRVARQLEAAAHGGIAGLRRNDVDATWERLSKGGSFARRSDIRELLMENGLPWDRATVGDLFDELDRDGSGRVTREEWFRFCDRNPRVAGQLGATTHGGSAGETRVWPVSSAWQLTVV